MSDVGDGIKSVKAAWTFGGDTANTFDSHVSKSVPLYHLGQKLACNISDYFIKDDGSVSYDIGSSTGGLTLHLAEHHRAVPRCEVRRINVRFNIARGLPFFNPLLNITSINDMVTSQTRANI